MMLLHRFFMNIMFQVVDSPGYIYGESGGGTTNPCTNRPSIRSQERELDAGVRILLSVSYVESEGDGCLLDGAVQLQFTHFDTMEIGTSPQQEKTTLPQVVDITVVNDADRQSPPSLPTIAPAGIFYYRKGN